MASFSLLHHHRVATRYLALSDSNQGGSSSCCLFVQHFITKLFQNQIIDMFYSSWL